MRTLRHFTLCLLAMLCAQLAWAKPEFLQTLTATYKANAGPLSQRGCANCHISPSDFKMNPYGLQLKREVDVAAKKVLTAEMLQKIEALDADGDGVSNVVEIKAGTPPGQAQKPIAATKEASPNLASPPPPPANNPLLPRNAFHPAMVHFPIGLFLGGLLLDFLGVVLKHKAMIYAGWCNLVLGALGALGGVATGLLARWQMHLPLEGLIRTHLIFAVSGTVVMWVMIFLRVGRHENMRPSLRTLYYILALLGAFLIIYTGHLGGLFVYGE